MCPGWIEPSRSFGKGRCLSPFLLRSGQCSAVGHFAGRGLLVPLGYLRQAGGLALWKGLSFSLFIISDEARTSQV